MDRWGHPAVSPAALLLPWGAAFCFIRTENFRAALLIVLVIVALQLQKSSCERKEFLRHIEMRNEHVGI